MVLGCKKPHTGALLFAAEIRTTSPGRLPWGCCLGSQNEYNEEELLWDIGDSKGHVLQGLIRKLTCKLL